MSDTPPRAPQLINFLWLLRLRWWVLGGQILTILGVEWALRIHLPRRPLALLVGLGILSNAACALWVRRAPQIRETMLAALMGFDVLLLTGLLSLTGGTFNPFSCLYLVHIALAAVVLRPRLTWMLVALSLGCFGLLFVIPARPPGAAAAPHMEHMRMHLEGMWLAFGVAAGFIVYFVQRVTRALAEREAELVAARNLTARNERFAALATLAAGAAHELSTPLSTIAVVAKELEHQLLRSPRSAEAVADARLIREQVTRCRDILMHMAADAGQGTGEAILATTVESLIEAAIDGVPDRARLCVAVDEGACGQSVDVPPRAVAQALRGVLKNARQASPPEAGGPLDITFWGPFPSGTTFCLRMLGRAMQTCVDEALAAQHECMDAELAGQPCDEALRDQRINDAKLASRSVVTSACTGGQLTELHFINPDDARTDVSKTCTDQPNAVMSVAYAPAIASGSSAATDEQTRQCLVKTSAYSRKLVRYMVRAKTQALNLMAVNVLGPAKKNALLKRAADRITAARAKLAQSILQVCPSFEAMYGRTPDDVLSGLSRVGDCVAGAAYVQTSVACPASICGNGVKESGEECDDGNTVDNDRCHDDCTTQ